MSPWSIALLLTALLYSAVIVLWYRWARSRGIVRASTAQFIVFDRVSFKDVSQAFLFIFTGLVLACLAIMLASKGVALKFIFLPAAFSFSFTLSAIQCWPQLFKF